MPVHDPCARRVMVHRAVARRLVLRMARRRIVALGVALLLIVALRRTRAVVAAAMLLSRMVGTAVPAIRVGAIRSAALMDLRIAAIVPLIAALPAAGVLPAVMVALNAAAVAVIGCPPLRAARGLIDDGLLRATTLALPLAAVVALPLAAVAALPLAPVAALIGLRALGTRRLIAHLGIAAAAVGAMRPAVGTVRTLQLLARRWCGPVSAALRAAGRVTAVFLARTPTVTALLAAMLLTGPAALAAITLLSRAGGLGGDVDGRNR
ncbi:hypothetical protein L2D00_07055 [Hyphomonadaceae bacterium BL14]|nr:hypothetical protein L2D00_07055 [Hyphomonadaceae bacterium BL14]